MGLIRITAPEGEPVVPADVIAHLRLPDDTSEDVLLTGYVTAAREMVEGRTHRALLSQVWELTLEGFPCWGGGERAGGWGYGAGSIQLPYPPLQSVASVKYVDADGTTQTLDPAAYVVETAGIVGRVWPAFGTSWPVARRQHDAVTIRFTAGYGDAAAVPAGLKAAILLLTANLYENREATIAGTIITEVPFTVAALLDPYLVLEPS